MMAGKNDDILDLPHPEHRGHPKMSMSNRAAQFSPFVALTGFETVIQEAARQLEPRVQLQEDAQHSLNAALLQLKKQPEGNRVRITYFEKEGLEELGRYETGEIRVLRVDLTAGTLITEEGRQIPFSDIRRIDFFGTEDFE